MTHPDHPTGPPAGDRDGRRRPPARTPLGDALRTVAAEFDALRAAPERCHTDPRTGNLVVEGQAVECA